MFKHFSIATTATSQKLFLKVGYFIKLPHSFAMYLDKKIVGF